jgi:membrane associated rhomboid family serine protease
LQALPYILSEENPLEAQTDIKTYLDQGKQALSHGEGREAAIAYAHAAQLEPENPQVHLGLAQANLALRSYGIVQVACQRTQELAPSGFAYELAQALLNLLDRHYDQALQRVDSTIKDDPGNAYAHALRAYLLRVTGQDYDAGLARSRASRLSFGGTFENCFPPVEPVYARGYAGQPTGFAPPATPDETAQPVQQREQVPAWSRPNQMQRRMIRTRFWMSQNPRFVTNILIALNVLTYMVLALLSQNIIEISSSALINMGGQVNFLVAQGEVWRIFTAMFLHAGIAHIGLNMLSLFFIGPAVELFYGKWRYLVIYLASGIIGGVVSYFMLPQGVLIGASGAIAGIFGALGAFFFVNRRALGAAANAMLGQWLFWLLINVAFDFSSPGIGWQAHLGGLASGLILGVVLIPPLRRIGRGV